MPTLADLTDPGAVVRAIEEFDSLGRDAFLSTYGYGRAKHYFLVHRGSHYDSKAIAGVAFGKQHGRPLLNSEFSGGTSNAVPALQRLGFTIIALALDEDVAALSEELTGTFPEGLSRTVTVNRWERSAKARLACIEAHGTSCACCGISFARTYGDDFTGLIHVHHLVRGADLLGEREINPADDLVPVCPNCHAVIHYGGENRPLEAVRTALAAASARAG